MLQYKDIRSFSKFHPVDPTTGKSVKGKSYIKQTEHSLGCGLSCKIRHFFSILKTKFP